MSLLYNDIKDRKYSVTVTQDEKAVNMLFTSDCGKHGTEEIIDQFNMTPKQLLDILQKDEDQKIEE